VCNVGCSLQYPPGGGICTYGLQVLGYRRVRGGVHALHRTD